MYRVIFYSVNNGWNLSDEFSDIEKAHYHRTMIELLIFLEGKAKFKVNDQEFIVEKGSFVFIDKNNSFKYD